MGEVRRYICLQARGGLKPIVDVVTRRAAALLIKMIGVVTNSILAGILGRNSPAGRSGINRCGYF
jgi:hypothetical protein